MQSQPHLPIERIPAERRRRKMTKLPNVAPGTEDLLDRAVERLGKKSIGALLDDLANFLDELLGL